MKSLLQKTIQKKINCFDSAMRSLQRKAYFSWELIHKLQEKEYASREINEAIEQCKKSLLLDDTNLFKYHIHIMQTERRWGRYKIRHKLQKKYIPQDIVEQMIETYYSVDLEQQAKEELTNLKKIEYAPLPEWECKNKIRSFLYSRGF